MLFSLWNSSTLLIFESVDSFKLRLKGTVARDLRLSVSFINQPHLGPWYTGIDNIRISAGSLTPLKLPEFFLLNFSYEITKLWNDSKISCETISAGSLTPLKFIWPRWNRHFGPITFFKGNVPQNYFIGISPYHILILNKKIDPCYWPRWNRFWRLSKRLSRRIRSHMRNGCIPWIRALGGVDWWKKPRVENRVQLSL
jgi:hypothetical protein